MKSEFRNNQYTGSNFTPILFFAFPYSIGLGNHVAEEYGIPMRARMIHNLDGSTYPVPYGKDGQAIYSVGRRYVNEILLDGK